MSKILFLIDKAVNDGRYYEIAGGGGGLTDFELTELKKARRRVSLPSVPMIHPKLFRDPAHAAWFKARAEEKRERRRARNRRLLARCGITP